MSIQLGKEHIAAITRHGEAAYPFEGCGLLLGRAEDGRKSVVRVLPVENTRETEARHNRYLIPPEAVMKAEQQAGRGAWILSGSFTRIPTIPNSPVILTVSMRGRGTAISSPPSTRGGR